MAINTSSHFFAIEPIVQNAFGLRTKKHKEQFSKIFATSMGKEAVRYSIETGGQGLMSEKAEMAPASERDIKSGPRKSWRYTVYASYMTMSMEMARDNKIKEIESAAKSAGRARALTPEYICANFLGNGYTTTTTADGKALFATDHLIVGENAYTGQNMLSSASALTATSYENVLIALRQTKYADGLLGPNMAKQLVVPSSLDATAFKLAKTQKVVGSQNNDVSYVAGRDYMVFDYLVDQNDWFVQTDMEDGLFWEWDIKGDSLEDNETKTLAKTWLNYFRARLGVDDWRCVYGSGAVA